MSEPTFRYLGVINAQVPGMTVIETVERDDATVWLAEVEDTANLPSLIDHPAVELIYLETVDEYEMVLLLRVVPRSHVDGDSFIEYTADPDVPVQKLVGDLLRTPENMYIYQPEGENA